MRNVFASTTAILATEFVEKFTENRLNFTLSKVGRKTGVKFSRSNNTISIAGLWPWILEAHAILLRDVRSLEGTSDYEDSDLSVTVGNADLSRTPPALFQSGNLAKQKGHIPEPVVYYEYKDQLHGGRDIISPDVLVDVVNNVKNAAEAAALRKIITDTYKKSKEDAFGKHQSAIESLSLDEIKETEKTKTPSKKKAKLGRDSSRRKSTPKKYVAPETEAVNQEPGVTQEPGETKEPGVTQEPGETQESGETQGPGETEEPGETEGDDTALSESATEKTVVKSRRTRRGRKRLPQNTSTSFPCEECPYVGRERSHLRKHRNRQHGIRFRCDQCDRSFGSIKDLNRHKHTVHAAAEHFCQKCNKFYKTKHVFDEHVKCHQVGYVKPSFDCKMCVKKFSNKYVLATHIRAEHLGMKRSYICPTCGRSFTQKNTYRQHANVHAGIKPYVCGLCGKAFTYEKSLREHKFLHEGIRRFHCQICTKSFLQSTSLHNHMKVHREARDFMCTACGKGFTQKQALIRHERVHSGDKPYSCSLCEKHFSDYSIIRRHVISVHKKDQKNWRDSIVSTVKAKKGYYIDGGPRQNYRTSSQKALTHTECEFIAEAVDKAIKVVTDGHGTIESNVSDKVGVIKDAAMPLNFSIQPSSSFSTNVSSGPTQDHNSQESLVNRNQQLGDMYIRDFQHQRGLYVPALTPQPPNLQYAAPVASNQVQSLHNQPPHNQWSFLGPPTYYNPANFSQFQGPQN